MDSFEKIFKHNFMHFIPLQYSGPEIRWVDGGKELFSVGFILASTVYCKVSCCSLLYEIPLYYLIFLIKKVFLIEIKYSTFPAEYIFKNIIYKIMFCIWFIDVMKIKLALHNFAFKSLFARRKKELVSLPLKNI